MDINWVDYISLLLEQLAYSSISSSTDSWIWKKSIFSFYKNYTACLRLKYYIFKINASIQTLNFRSEIIIKFCNSVLHTLVILSKKTTESIFVLWLNSSSQSYMQLLKWPNSMLHLKIHSPNNLLIIFSTKFVHLFNLFLSIHGQTIQWPFLLKFRSNLKGPYLAHLKDHGSNLW